MTVLISDHNLFIRTILRSLCVVICFAGLSASVVYAQQQHSSHRRLRMPDGGSSDIHRQMQMLQQLRSLFSGQSPNSSTPDQPSANAQHLQMLRQMMNQFGGSMPKDLLNNLPPHVVSDIARNPETRRQIRELLEEYSRTQRLPRGAENSGPSVLPPEANNRRQAPRNDSDQVSPRKPRQDSAGTSGKPEADESQSWSINDMLEKLKDLEREYHSESKPDNGPSPSDSNSRPHSSEGQQHSPRPEAEPDNDDRAKPAGRPPAGRANAPQTEDDWARYMEELIQMQRGQTQSNTEHPEEIADSAGSSSSPSTSPSPKRTESLGGQQSQPITSVSEFLKDFNRQQPADAAQPSSADAVAKSNGHVTPAPSQHQESTADDSSNIRQIQEEVKSELAQKGLRETLWRIARDARKEARHSAPADTISEGTSDSKLSGAMAEALAGVTRDVLKMVRNGDFKPSQRQRKERSGTRESGPSAFGEIQKSASQFFSDMAAAPSVSSGPGSSGPGAVGSPASESLLLPVVVLIVLAGAALVLSWRFGLISPAAIGISPYSSATNEIQSRADVVNAFHALALNPEQSSETWWTHDRVTRKLVEQKPDRSDSFSALATLYEQARYLPDDMEFTADQIRAAKLALSQCR